MRSENPVKVSVAGPMFASVLAWHVTSGRAFPGSRQFRAGKELAEQRDENLSLEYTLHRWGTQM